MDKIRGNAINTTSKKGVKYDMYAYFTPDLHFIP